MGQTVRASICARFLVEVKWRNAVSKFVSTSPSRAHAPEGFLFPAAPKPLSCGNDGEFAFWIARFRAGNHFTFSLKRAFVGGEESGYFAPMMRAHTRQFMCRTVEAPMRLASRRGLEQQ